VIQAAGIPNVLTKSIGTHNPHNVVKATINALEQLRDLGHPVTKVRDRCPPTALDEIRDGAAAVVVGLPGERDVHSVRADPTAVPHPSGRPANTSTGS